MSQDTDAVECDTETYEVVYTAVLEYEDGELPADPRETMFGLISRQPDFGDVVVEEVSR